MIYLNKLKKTKKDNKSYKLSFVKKGKLTTIGSYNQSNNKLIVDILALLFLVGEGEKFSFSFSKIFKQVTGIVTRKKLVSIKY